jgi:hypothetical protein
MPDGNVGDVVVGGAVVGGAVVGGAAGGGGGGVVVVVVVVVVVLVLIVVAVALPGGFVAEHAAARSARVATIPEQATLLRFIREKGRGPRCEAGSHMRLNVATRA